MANTDKASKDILGHVVDALNTGVITSINTEVSAQTAPLFHMGTPNPTYVTPGKSTQTTHVTITSDPNGTVWTDNTTPNLNQDYFVIDPGAGTAGTYNTQPVIYNSGYISIAPPLFNLADNKDDDMKVLVCAPTLGTLVFINGGGIEKREADDYYDINNDVYAHHVLKSNEILAHFSETKVDIVFGNKFTAKELATLIALLSQYESESVYITIPKRKTDKYSQNLENIKNKITTHLGVQVNES
ncbi:MAG: hypothetical protein H8D23_19255 [Candidatus Brocadiales bacterium]|nr:hypothetical protein [Candidatus Brocadiales bacterium]